MVEFGTALGNGTDYFATVDIYNSMSRTWSTASLSEAWGYLAATTVGDLALFGGGSDTGDIAKISLVDIYNATSGIWSTASLSQAQGALSATSLQELAIFGGGGSMGISYPSVDIYNSTSGTWSTATLSEARQNLAATSVGDLALFGGGQSSTSYCYATVDLFFYPSIPLVTPITEDITATFSSTSLQANLILSSGNNNTPLSLNIRY